MKHAAEQLVEEFDRHVDFVVGDVERGGQREDVLVISAHVQDQAVFLPLVCQIGLQTLTTDLVRQFLARRIAVILTDLYPQSEAETVDIADVPVFRFQVPEPLEEFPTFPLDGKAWRAERELVQSSL